MVPYLGFADCFSVRPDSGKNFVGKVDKKEERMSRVRDLKNAIQIITSAHKLRADEVEGVREDYPCLKLISVWKYLTNQVNIELRETVIY